MKPTVLILGGGGHAKVLIGALLSGQEFVIAGILDANIAVGQSVMGIPVLGDEAWLDRPEAHAHGLAIGVGAMRGDDTRRRIFERCREQGYRFPVIRHAEAFADPTAVIGEGTQLMAGAVVQPMAVIGPNAILNTAAVVEHDCIVGAHAHIAPGAVLGGNVRVGDCALVGLGARVLPGITIGHHVTVGAGAVVVDNVADGAVVRGVPARTR